MKMATRAPLLFAAIVSCWPSRASRSWTPTCSEVSTREGLFYGSGVIGIAPGSACIATVVSLGRAAAAADWAPDRLSDVRADVFIGVRAG